MQYITNNNSVSSDSRMNELLKKHYERDSREYVIMQFFDEAGVSHCFLSSVGCFLKHILEIWKLIDEMWVYDFLKIVHWMDILLKNIRKGYDLNRNVLRVEDNLFIQHIKADDLFREPEELEKFLKKSSYESVSEAVYPVLEDYIVREKLFFECPDSGKQLLEQYDELERRISLGKIKRDWWNPVLLIVKAFKKDVILNMSGEEIKRHFELVHTIDIIHENDSEESNRDIQFP